MSAGWQDQLAGERDAIDGVRISSMAWKFVSKWCSFQFKEPTWLEIIALALILAFLLIFKYS
jgi:hypothetical protein